MSGRTTAWAWLTAWAIESSQSDHRGRTSDMPSRGVERGLAFEPGSAATRGGDLSGPIATDHRAPELTLWTAPGFALLGICVPRGARHEHSDGLRFDLSSPALRDRNVHPLSLIHISEPTRLGMISY